MAASGAKKAQQKIFGTTAMEAATMNDGARCAVSDAGDDHSGCSSSNLTQGHGLTLIIPKPKLSGSAPPSLPKKPASDQSPKVVDDINGGDDAEEGEEVIENVSFRQRLAKTLGEEYRGAERYRLIQDDKKEKHWKRWGPYLSDRQWVGLCIQLGLMYGLMGGLIMLIMYRRLLEKTILQTVMHGVIFHMNMQDRGLIDGVRMG